jgi:hypothetical protein
MDVIVIALIVEQRCQSVIKDDNTELNVSEPARRSEQDILGEVLTEIRQLVRQVGAATMHQAPVAGTPEAAAAGPAVAATRRYGTALHPWIAGAQSFPGRMGSAQMSQVPRR